MMNINMFGTRFCVAAALGLLAGTVSAVESVRPFAGGKGPSTCDGRRLVWSDEFDGTALDPAKWGYELGFIRNREYQFYTNLEENVRVEGGKLVLQARRVDWPNPGYDAAAPTNDWKRTRPKLTITSGSVNTRGKFAFAGGRLECRAKVPAHFGTWPAIWTLGANIGEIGWPKCGEIDVLEHYGKTPDWVTCNLHGFSLRDNKYASPGVSKLTGETPADGFHVYAMEWNRQGVTCFYDGRPYGRYTFEKYGEAFAKPHYILLNLAMGAPWMMPEKDVVVEDATRFEIDWIRVYE